MNGAFEEASFDPSALIRQRIERSTRDLPPLPTAVLKVLDETDRADTTAARVESIILSDQALTAQVLRVVNSAYYGMSGKVSSVSQAVMILGLQQVRNLTLSVAAISSFQPSSSRHRETLKCFWSHAFATAATTQLIRNFKRLPAQTAESIFIGGLIHDIGRLFLFVNFTNAYDQVIDRAAKEDITLEEAERALLGLNHAQVGLQIATNWKLPESLRRMIGDHEGPFDAETPVELLVIHIADALNKPLYFPSTGKTNVVLDPFASDWFGVDESAYTALQIEVAQRVDEMATQFGFAA